MPWQYMVKDSIIRKILLAEMPDMIEVTDKYTLSLIGPMIRTKRFSRNLGVRCSCISRASGWTTMSARFLSGRKVGKWFARRVIGNYTMPNFDYHIANSTYTAEEFYDVTRARKNTGRSEAFLNACWRFFKAPRVASEERIFVCPRGVDSSTFTPERQSDKVKRRNAERAGIPAGRDHFALRRSHIAGEKCRTAVRNDEDSRQRSRLVIIDLLVAGAGPQSGMAEIARRKLRRGKIVLLGHLDKETLADYYANADVFVHPNPKEPFGIAPLEAMASGVADGRTECRRNSVVRDERKRMARRTRRRRVRGGDLRDHRRSPKCGNGRSRRRWKRHGQTHAKHRPTVSSRHTTKYTKISKADKELFTNIEAAKNFDFVEEILRPTT